MHLFRKPRWSTSFWGECLATLSGFDQWDCVFSHSFVIMAAARRYKRGPSAHKLTKQHKPTEQMPADLNCQLFRHQRTSITYNLDQGIVEACAHGSHVLCAELAGARNYGGLVHAAVASEGNPVFFDRKQFADTVWHGCTVKCGPLYEALNQRGGDMLTGATVVHQKEALYGHRGSRCMSWNPSKPFSRVQFHYPGIWGVEGAVER